jgi:type IV pilus assembly protein PilQ
MMMRTNRQIVRAAALMAALALMALAAAANPGTAAREVRVEAAVHPDGVRIEATATGAFDYTTYRPSERLFVVDLAGVTPAAGPTTRVLKSDLVASYRVLQFRGGDRALVRLEILLRAPVEPRVERLAADKLAVIIGGQAASAAGKSAEAPAAAQPAARPAVKAEDTPATELGKVAVEQQDGRTQVKIEGNGRLTCEVIRMSNPDRVVVDFRGVKARVAQKQIASAIQPVRGVRVGQFRPDVARVVIDLHENNPHRVRAQGRYVFVDFALSQSANTPAPAPQTAPMAEAAAAPVLPAEAKEAQKDAKSEMTELPMPQVVLPLSLTQAAGVMAPAAQAAATPQAQQSPQQAGASADKPAEPVASAPMAAPAQQQGEPISVNLKDVDLKDFFRLISDISGLNVVVDPAVRGSVTLVLNEVPWNQALDIVLRNNSLDKQLEGNVLRIATRDTLKKEAEQRRDLAKAQAQASEMVVTTRVLSYAKAGNLRDTLKRFLSDQGEILSDDRSNTIIIRDIPNVLPQIDNLIKQLDRRSQQVEIEARVVAASRSFMREIGVQFGFATTSTGGRTVWGGLTGLTSFTSPVVRGAGLPTPPLVSTGTSSIPLNVNLPAVAPNSGVTFAHASPNFAVDYIISAAEARGVGKLLSKPKVITQNNLKGLVKQGTKIPVQTVINNTISVQFIDAVLQLEVTPQIAADGSIFMEVKVENTAIDNGIPRVGGIPALTTQEATTSVLINDGETVVVGGVMITSQNTDIAQTPLFGSIPLIGHLFKRTSVRTQSQELYFFVTPRIIGGN